MSCDAAFPKAPAPAPATPAAAADAAKFSAEDLEFFEKEVRPILVARCYECHSRDAKKVQGGFLVDSRAGALKGGDTGPAVVPRATDARVPEMDRVARDDVRQPIERPDRGPERDIFPSPSPEALIEAADLDEDQQRRLERELGRQYHLLTRDDRLETVAKDIVQHFARAMEEFWADPKLCTCRACGTQVKRPF